MAGPQPEDHAGAMGEEVGGIPGAGGGHGRGLVVLGFINPRSVERGRPVHAWRASAVVAEGRGQAVVEVSSHDAGDGGSGFESVVRRVERRSDMVSGECRGDKASGDTAMGFYFFLSAWIYVAGEWPFC